MENYLANTRTHISSAYMTFVAVDSSGRPVPVPPVVPETEEENQRYEDAGRRREHRLAERELQRARSV